MTNNSGESLSAFRIARLLADLRVHAPALQAVEARDLYLVDAHGVGVAELRRLLGDGPDAIAPADLVLYVVPRVGYPDPTTFHATYAQLTAFLDGWLQDRAITWDRTLIGGFSMGCVMSYATGLGPGRPSPAGILAMSGFIPTVEGWEPELATREDLPVFICHGARDPGPRRRVRSRTK